MSETTRRVFIVVSGLLLIYTLMLCGKPNDQAVIKKRTRTQVKQSDESREKVNTTQFSFADVLPPSESEVVATDHYRIVRVIDGDTIVINQGGKDVRLRLIGIDTPETVHPSKPVEYYGKEASAFLSSLLTNQDVYLGFDQVNQQINHQDRFGRLLAYVYRCSDSLFVNAEIVRQGYGFAYTKYPFSYMEYFRSLEKDSRESMRGLWGG